MNKAIPFLENAIKITIVFGGMLAVAFLYVSSHANSVNERNNKTCEQLCDGMAVYKCVSETDKWYPQVQEAWCVEVDRRSLKK